MKIPKKFNLINDEITVVVDDNIFEDRDAYGEANFRQNKIFIVNKEKHSIPNSQMERVFFHELLHHCFNQLNEQELNDNEKLIDNLARLLAQAFSTMKF